MGCAYQTRAYNSMNLTVTTIPHDEQRYDTLGDYYEMSPGHWLFTMSDLGDPDTEFCVLIHELVEWYLTQRHGISEASITEWDTEYQGSEDEPGDDLLAPYHAEHQVAERIEVMVAEELSRDGGRDDAASLVSVTGQ